MSRDMWWVVVGGGVLVLVGIGMFVAGSMKGAKWSDDYDKTGWYE